jgi:hypothetical protein
MSPDQWVTWAGPSSLVGFATVLWYLARKIMARLDAQDERAAEIKAMLATELRGLDVRLSVVEAQLRERR